MNASAIKQYEWYLKILSILHEPYKLVSKVAFIRLTFLLYYWENYKSASGTLALIFIAFNHLLQVKN